MTGLDLAKVNHPKSKYSFRVEELPLYITCSAAAVEGRGRRVGWNAG